MKIVLVIVAVVLFALAALLGVFSNDIDRDVIVALVPAGLAFWAGSSLVP